MFMSDELFFKISDPSYFPIFYFNFEKKNAQQHLGNLETKNFNPYNIFRMIITYFVCILHTLS